MKLLVLACSAVFLITSSAFSITLDKFQQGQYLEVFKGSESTSSNAPTAGISDSVIGGIRGTTLNWLGSSNCDPGQCHGSINVSSSNNTFSQSEDDDTRVRTMITWDGNNTIEPYGALPTGLFSAPLDLEKDNSSAILLDIRSFDFGGAKPVFVTLRLFTSPTAFSSATLSLNKFFTSPEVWAFRWRGSGSEPFASFVAQGPDGGANFNNIRAIQMLIRYEPGNEGTATDLKFGPLKTNGNCSHVPQINSNGSYSIIGQCDTCLTNGELPENDPMKNDCGLCPQHPRYNSCLDCANNPCLLTGDPKTGTCTDQSVRDVCGTCDSNPDNNGQECLDCAGIPNGGTGYDLCNVCGGTNACVDCAGTPNGGKVKDRCNVCGGDGQSCVKCETQNLRPLAFTLDAQAKQQENAAVRMLTHLLQTKPTASNKKYSKNITQEIHALQIRNWVISWSIELENTQCIDPTQDPAVKPTFCTERAVNTSLVDEYRKHANAIYVLTKQIAAKLKKTSKKLNSIADRGIRDGSRKLQKALELADKVPLKATVCS